MKYLSDYMEEKQTKLFNETGTFFAFSDKQFKEQYIEEIKYVSLGSGMITPKKYANKVIETLYKIHKEAILEDLEDNGIQGVIQRELENYEVYYTNDLRAKIKREININTGSKLLEEKSYKDYKKR